MDFKEYSKKCPCRLENYYLEQQNILCRIFYEPSLFGLNSYQQCSKEICPIYYFIKEYINSIRKHYGDTGLR